MSRIHAYYLPAHSASTEDPHPVGVEHLDALGWKISFIGGNVDERETVARSRAQELGYPVTQEGGALALVLEPEDTSLLAPEAVAMLTKLQQSVSGPVCSDICATKDILAVVTSGSPFLHIEDVTTNAWIHLDVVPGMFIRFPAGAKYRLTSDERNKKAVGTAFFKETVYNHGILTKTEIENNPIRKAYINAFA